MKTRKNDGPENLRRGRRNEITADERRKNLFHSYFLWPIYNEIMPLHPEWYRGEITEKDVLKTREGRYPIASDWPPRIAQYCDIRKERLPDIEWTLEEALGKKRRDILRSMERSLSAAMAASAGGRMPVVCGEGVSYIASYELLWEERSEKCWELVRTKMRRYREAGLWGTVIRTNCGPEDPSWTLNKDRLLALNREFLAD